MMATQFWSSARKRLSGSSKKAPASRAAGNAEIPEESSRNQNSFGLFRIYGRAAAREDVQPISELVTKSPDASDNVDIVAIHGLGGTAFKTWTHDNGKMWLRDFAPSHFPGARIFTFGYDSGIAFSRGTGTVSDFAKVFLEAIKLERQTPEVRFVLK